MRVDVRGKIRNATVPKSMPLLPVFEAVVNSFQAISDSQRGHGRVRIHIVRSPSTTPEEPGDILAVRITDDGIGFTSENFDHFITADTMHKAPIGGKGIGRFSWLCVFERSRVSSTFMELGRMKRRTFAFSVSEDPEETCTLDDAPVELDTGSEVFLEGVKPDFQGRLPKSLDAWAQALSDHCILYLTQHEKLRVILSDDASEIDLVSFCADYALDRSFKKTFSANGRTFDYIGIRRSGAIEVTEKREHKLHLAAHGRPVTTLNLRGLVPNLKGHTRDEAGEPMSYTAYVTGSTLDEAVNLNRTAFDLPRTLSDRTQQLSVFSEPSVDEIVQGALECLNEDLSEVFRQLNSKKLNQLTRFVSERPEFRPILKDAAAFVGEIPAGAGPVEMEKVLYDELNRRKKMTREQCRNALRDIQESDDRAFSKAVENVMQSVNDLGMSALAEYVAQRKVILDFLEKSLGIDPETKKHRLESVLHSFVFPMNVTSGDVDFHNQNLWLVDERLCFHTYLASDKSLKSIEALDSTDNVRPDVFALFDRYHILGEGNRYPLHSFVVIEFKRPSHTDYRKDNPIAQVYEQIERVRASSVVDVNGRKVSLAEGAAAYGYIICDIESDELQRYASYAQLQRTADGLGFFGFNSSREINAYIEVISYTKLLNDARMRNHVLFERLGIV